MKANDAPEKIYLEAAYPNNGVLPNGLNYSPSLTDIEYTRTDAFIEKASVFLCECIEDCMARYMETWSPEMKEKTVDNFKNYMKGE